MDLIKMLQAQRDLQVKSFGADPMALEGEARTEFIRWNAYALEDEVHEMTSEVGWKPWASSMHVNEEAALKELVDALHFFLNLCLAAAPRGWTVQMLGHTIGSFYATKNAENARRQAEGYDGVTEKCAHCKRDLRTTEPILLRDALCCPCGTPIPEEAP